MGEPSLRPPFPTFEKLISEHDDNNDRQINRDELPTLWIFHRPDGAEAPMNGGTVGFDFADKNKDRGITEEEWATTVHELERFRSGYDTHGILAIPIDSHGLLGTENIRTLETQGIPEVPSPLYHDGYVYFVKNGGILTCLDVETGQRVYRTRTAWPRNPLRIAADSRWEDLHHRRRWTHQCSHVGSRPADSRQSTIWKTVFMQLPPL